MIRPITNPYSSIVMVFKKDDKWHMCMDFHALHKLTIKEKFLIPIIDDRFG